MNERVLPQSIAAGIDAAFAAADPRKVLVAGPTPLTYGALHDHMDRLNALFQRLALAPGDRVVIASGNDIAVIALYFAVVRAGLVAVIGNGDTTAEEVIRLVDAADPRLAFVDRATISPEELLARMPAGGHAIAVAAPARHARPGLIAKLLRGREEAPAPVVDASAFPHMLDGLEPAAPAPAPDGNAVAHMLFTSGTTSRPKGVEITHANLLAQLSTFSRVYGYDADSRILNVLPLHHTDGLMQGPVVAFMAGATVYRPGRFRVQMLPDMMDSIYRERITHFIAVPTMLALIMRLGEVYDDCFRGDDFRVLRSSADLLDPTLWSDFEARFGVEVTNSYGLTETVCEAIYCGPSAETRRIGTIGKPIDCDIRIVDEAGSDVAAGDVGELWIRGTNIMKGYFRAPEETAAVLTDGWYHTGDLAAVDGDGFLTVAGRKKTVIITGGTNVHPENVTTAIRALDGVIDAVTFGAKDGVWGEVVVSCVVVAPESGLDRDAVLAHCRASLPREKVPAQLHLLEELPRGPAGKVLLDEVKAMAADHARAGAGHVSGGVGDQVRAIAAEVFNVPVSTLTLRSTPDNTNGWDSLAHMTFVAALESRFAFRMSPREIMSLSSLSDAERTVHRALDSPQGRSARAELQDHDRM